MSNAGDYFLAEFARLAADLPGAGHPEIDLSRTAALERFAEQGVPLTRLEDWKYTNLAQLERKPLPVALADEATLPSLAHLKSLAVLPDAAHFLVFVDGHFAPSLSHHSLPANVRAGALASRIADQPEAGLPLAPAASPADLSAASRVSPPPSGSAALAVALAGETSSALVSLNLAFSADGLDLVIPAGEHIAETIVVLYVSATPERSVFPASRIHLGKGARATLLEQHVSVHDMPGVDTVVERISLDAGAELHHIKVQQEGARHVHLADTSAILAEHARLRSLVLALGGQLGREDLRITLAGPHAHVELDGLYMPNRRMHLDHHTMIHHASPDCSSRQTYRGILDDAGRGVFNGRVVVAREAQHTDAQQSNANLLLSDNAEIDTKPQLEIFADNVKCSHGATVGQLDPAELFYLRSRGLDESAARALVTFAFAARSLGGIDADSALYTGLRSLLFGHLPGGAALEDLTR